MPSNMFKYTGENSTALQTSPAASLPGVSLSRRSWEQLLRVWEGASPSAADTLACFWGAFWFCCAQTLIVAACVCLVGGMGHCHIPLLTCPSATALSPPLGGWWFGSETSAGEGTLVGWDVWEEGWERVGTRTNCLHYWGLCEKRLFLGMLSLHGLFLLSSNLNFFPVTSYLGYMALSSSGGGDGGPPLWDDEARQDFI